jgi:hypothetical protein
LADFDVIFVGCDHFRGVAKMVAGARTRVSAPLGGALYDCIGRARMARSGAEIKGNMHGKKNIKIMRFLLEHNLRDTVDITRNNKLRRPTSKKNDRNGEAKWQEQ